MCDICASGLAEELNKKRNWRPDRVIKWAGRRGLKITEPQLQIHYAEHLPPPDKPAKAEASPRPKTPEKAKLSAKAATTIPEIDVAGKGGHFLNEVVRRVFDDLVEGKFELKLEHGFKAIEIKQKLADKADTENMLLELLNEIRNQELAR